MEFRTEVKVSRRGGMEHDSGVMLVGSCFTERIGERLERLMFRTFMNPTGITYNPISIAKALERTIDGTPYDERELEERDGKWFSKEHHGMFDTADRNETLRLMNERLAEAAKFWKTCQNVVVTMGSSVVYERGGEIYNNCHKLPGREFSMRRLTADEIVESWERILPRMEGRRVIMTVSPVRYKGDEAISNSLNKGTLLIAVDRLRQKFGFVEYFPAYEIMMDELRDYRFYAEDMIHPSQLAAEVIFERFGETYFTEHAQKANREIAKLKLMEEHRPMHPESTEYEKFKLKLYEQKKIVDSLLGRSDGDNGNGAKQ